LNLSTKTWLLCALLPMLSSCASPLTLSSPFANKEPESLPRQIQQAKELITQGQAAQGIAQLETLAKQQPYNAEIRSHLTFERNAYLSRLTAEADQLRDKQQWQAATDLYQQVLTMDEQNQRAQEGLRVLKQYKQHEVLLTQAEELLQSADASSNTDKVQSIVSQVLSENSLNPHARSLYETLEKQRSEQLNASQLLKTNFKKNISIEFKDVSLKTIFDFISKVSDINFSFDQNFNQNQTTSIFARNTSIEQVIQTVLNANQLGQKTINANTLLIYPMSRNNEYQELYVRTFYLGNMEAKRAMNMLKTVIKAKDVYTDEKLNTLVMRDTPENIRLAEKLITSQDLPEPEVMLEVEVMEVSRKSLTALGIRYPSQVSVGVKGGDLTAPTAGQLSLSQLKNFNGNLGVFSITDPVLALNLLNQDSSTNLLASPHIRVKNREKAKIHIGDKLPVITSTANSVGFLSQSVNYLEVGIKLDVEPTILLHDEVSIKVGLEVSNQTDQVKTTSGTLTYTIGTRNANTVLRLKNGETQVLAGLFRDDAQESSNKVPGLAQLPLIGRLFGDKSSDKRKNEIVLLITPRILSNLNPPDATYSMFAAGVDNSTNKAGKAADSYASPVPSNTAPAAPTPQEIQANRARDDKAFADSVMQPSTP
jgi:general secretion pathway protein D